MLYYQPQVADDGKLIGAEAWCAGGIRTRPVSPAQFIRIAEETGLIYQLATGYLRRACEDLAATQCRCGPAHLGEYQPETVSSRPVSSNACGDPGRYRRPTGTF